MPDAFKNDALGLGARSAADGAETKSGAVDVRDAERASTFELPKHVDIVGSMRCPREAFGRARVAQASESYEWAPLLDELAKLDVPVRPLTLDSYVKAGTFGPIVKKRTINMPAFID